MTTQPDQTENDLEVRMEQQADQLAEEAKSAGNSPEKSAAPEQQPEEQLQLDESTHQAEAGDAPPAATSGDGQSHGSAAALTPVASLAATESSNFNLVPPPHPSKRYSKADSVTDNAFGSVTRRIFSAFDNESCNEVAWIEYTNVPKASIENFEERLALLTSLNHENLLNYYGGWADAKTKTIVFITELLRNNLRMILEKRIPMATKVLAGWVRGLSEGLRYLHEEVGTVHGNLMPSNLFIRGNSGQVKIGGLELPLISHSVHPTNLNIAGGIVSPEYTGTTIAADDIYALGLCVVEIFTCHPPWHDCGHISQIYRAQALDRHPPELLIVGKRSKVEAAFIARCLDPVDKRFTARELLQHQFLTSAPGSEMLDPNELPVAEGHQHQPVQHQAAAKHEASTRQHRKTKRGVNNNKSSLRRQQQLPANIKCFFVPAVRPVNQPMDKPRHQQCVRVRYNEVDSVDKLIATVRADFADHVSQSSNTVLKYLDEDGDVVRVTRRTTLEDLVLFAHKLFLVVEEPRLALHTVSSLLGDFVSPPTLESSGVDLASVHVASAPPGSNGGGALGSFTADTPFSAGDAATQPPAN